MIFILITFCNFADPMAGCRQKEFIIEASVVCTIEAQTEALDFISDHPGLVPTKWSCNRRPHQTKIAD